LKFYTLFIKTAYKICVLKKKIDMVNWNMYIINTSNLSFEEKSLSILLKKMIMGIDFKNIMLMACKKTKQVIT